MAPHPTPTQPGAFYAGFLAMALMSKHRSVSSVPYLQVRKAWLLGYTLRKAFWKRWDLKEGVMAGDKRHLLQKRQPDSSGPESIQAVSTCLTCIEDLSLTVCLATIYLQYHSLLSCTDTRL